MKNKLYLFLILFISINKIGFSQQENKIIASLETPFSTVFTHLHYLQDDSYEPEKSALTIYGDYSKEEKEDLAIKIKKVLDGKGLYIDMSLLPKDPNFTDSLNNKSIYYLSAKEKHIYLEKIDTSWYYSSTTLLNIDNIYKETYPFWAIYLDDIFPNGVNTETYFGIKTWQYLAVLILALISLLLYYIVKSISLLFIKKIALPFFKNKLPKEELLFKIAKSLSLVLTFLFIEKIIPSIQLPLKLNVFLILTNHILLIFLTAFLINNIFKLLLYYLEKAVEKTETKLDNQLLPILSKIGKLVIYVTAIVYVLQELEINITALLAGLSVGGLAIALASKDTVQNIIGSLNIFLDRPFEIGDYIILSETQGTVEEVGLRATRIRTQNQSLAYIPNGNLSNMTIDNYGLRIYRRWKSSFGLDYSTPPEKIELFIEEVKSIISKNKHTLDDKTMVYFHNLGASTLDIYLSVFFDVKSYREDLNCKQEILLQILKMTQENNIEFAFPSQTIYRK